MRIKNIVLSFANFIFFFSLNGNAQSTALAFDIYPKEGTALPTEILPGQTSVAYYTVKDNTGGPFPPDLYNYVKHLPKNVTQVTVDNAIPDLCGETFVLEPHGSCTLELSISGPVSSDCADASSDNPCLFVCMSDGFTCAGTAYPLEVKTTTQAHPVVGGIYYTNSFIATPMLAAFSTTKNNQAWNYTIDSTGPLPDMFSNNGVFIATTTTANTALAAGGYMDQFGNVYPMIAVSQEGGAHNTWSYTIDNSFVPTAYDGFAYFSNIDCIGETCVASGQYKTSSNTYPLLAVSKSSGAQGSWEYINTTAYPNGIFNSTSCSADTCIVGGQYQNGSIKYPLLLVNSDVSGSGTWQAVIDSTHPGNLPTDFHDNGIFFSVACGLDVCIAGGQYSNGAVAGYYPMLVVNQDVGGSGTWHQYVMDSTSGLPEDATGHGDSQFNYIKGTSCSNDICTAAGNYITTNNNYPLLTLSTNVGTDNVWNIIVDATTDYCNNYPNSSCLPSAYLTNGAFLAVSCSGNLCTAGGGYIGSDGVDYPVLIMSSNVSEPGTWDYFTEKGLGLPNNFTNGGSFFGVTCIGSLCVAEGYYAATDPDTSFVNYFPLMSSNLNGSWDYYIDDSGPLPSQYMLDGNGYGLFCGTTYPVCNF
ncbi:MAG: hypothetical protein WC748_08710 [Legionellales bacterium]|jgi:hypothetical protein